MVVFATAMKNKTKQKTKSNVPRQVRMPPAMDEWLEKEAEKSLPGTTVADKIREIVGEAYKAALKMAA